MKSEFKEEFMSKWQTYFGQTELPIAFYYTDEEGQVEKVKIPSGHQCLNPLTQECTRP